MSNIYKSSHSPIQQTTSRPIPQEWEHLFENYSDPVMIPREKKSIFFRLTDEEFGLIEAYCQQTGRTKSDVLRELIRKLETNKKPS